MPLKPVLLVSYYFPPLGGPGAIRPAKFCKYLPKFGWQPVVLTVKDIAYYTRDPFLGDDAAPALVHKSSSFDPARVLYLLGRRSVKWTGAPSSLGRLLRLPDSKLGWLIPAVLKGLPHARKSSLILATAPPFTSFLVGLLLGKLTRKPLVVDFRDAWLEFPFVPYRGIHRAINYRLEREVVRHAAYVIAVSNAIKASLIRRYPWLEEKIAVVPNGYDPDDFGRELQVRDFTITHLGTFRKSRNPEPVLAAVRQLIDEKQISPGTVVKFIGNILPDVAESVHRLRLENNVVFHNYLPHVQAMKELNASHLLFLITDEESQIFPSRQGEYLATGWPIMVIGPATNAEVFDSRRVKSTYPITAIVSDDIEKIKSTIVEFYRRYKTGTLRRRPLRLPEFNREVQAGKIAAVLDRLTSRPAVLSN